MEFHTLRKRSALTGACMHEAAERTQLCIYDFENFIAVAKRDISAAQEQFGI